MMPASLPVVDIVFPTFLFVHRPVIVTINHPVHPQHIPLVFRHCTLRFDNQGVPSCGQSCYTLQIGRVDTY